MPRLREEYDADLGRATIPTEHPTELNRFELPCGVCGALLYVDRETIQRYKRGLDHEIDSQFTCPECEHAYQDLEYR